MTWKMTGDVDQCSIGSTLYVTALTFVDQFLVRYILPEVAVVRRNHMMNSQ